MLSLILFFIFAALCVGGAINLLVQKHPINSALSLIVVMGSLALIYLLLGAEFVAAVQVIVYAGAVMVLFLFVIMLLDIKASERRKLNALGIVGGVVVAVAFVWELRIILGPAVKPLTSGNDELHGGLEQVVKPLFAHYMLPFEVTALLLLVAMVGVVLLSKRDSR